MSISLLIKKTRSVCLSDILDIDRGHTFRKHRHKNNKKVAVIYEKTVKKPAVARVFARQLPWGAYIKSAISHVCCAYAHKLI